MCSSEAKALNERSRNPFPVVVVLLVPVVLLVAVVAVVAVVVVVVPGMVVVLMTGVEVVVAVAVVLVVVTGVRCACDGSSGQGQVGEHRRIWKSSLPISTRE